MPLTLNSDGVKASVTASVGEVEAEVNGQLNGVKSGVTGRLSPTSRCVPLRLSALAETDGSLENGMTYVDDGTNSYRLSLKSIKQMNTKIVVTENVGDVDMSKLEVGDFIYEIK